MSIFKKLLASVGVGSARIDTRLDKDSYVPGEMIRGEVVVMGGEVAQTVDDIYLDIMTRVKTDDDSLMGTEASLVHHRLSARFQLTPRESKVIPLQLPIPLDMPISVAGFPIWVKTALEVQGANPTDRDQINILPTPIQNVVLNSLQLLGFQLYKVDCEYSRSMGGSFGLVQEFEFKPFNTNFRAALDELEVIFRPTAHGMDLLLVLDRRARGFNSFLNEVAGFDDKYLRLQLSHQDAQMGPQHVAGLIQNALGRALV